MLRTEQMTLLQPVKDLLRPISLCTGIVLASALATFAEAQEAWSDIADPADVRELVSGKVIDGRHFIQYYREDGNSAFFYGEPHNSLSVRKWTVREDGRLCVAPFSRPDAVTECYTLQRTSGPSPKYRFKSITGFHPFVIVEKVPANLANAVKKEAGARQ